MDFSLNLPYIVYTIIGIIVALSIHEAMHAFVGLKIGDTTAHEEGRVSLNPLRHIDPLTTIVLPIITLLAFGAPILAAKPVPFNPARVKWDEFGAALIALAGPISNLLLAILGVFLMRILGLSINDLNFLSVFVFLNVSLFVFNMVPIPPLDGSRVLYAFAPEPLQRVMEQLEQFGLFIVFGLIILVPMFGQMLITIDISILNWLLNL